MSVLLSALPLLALVAAHFAGAYPGEERLATARQRRAPGRLILLAPHEAERPRVTAPDTPRPPLLATSTAGRGPPRGGGTPSSTPFRLRSNHMIRSTTALTAALVLFAPALAQAHVTVQPKEATAGAYVVENVRVPNETQDATTTRIAVQMPPGFASVSYAAVPGWEVGVKKSKLATPVKTDDGEVTDQVDQITFTAAKGAGIAPGQFQDFPLSIKVPDEPGTLTFKAVQTYDNGDVVRWIGAPDADEPAPQLTVVPDTGTKQTVAATPTTATVTPPANDGGDGLAIAALVVGGLGLAAGLGALATVRRSAA